MPANTTTTENIQIPVPRQFRDYLVARQNQRYVFLLSLYAAVILFFALVLDKSWHLDLIRPFLIGGSLFFWWQQTKRPWYYLVDRKRIKLVWFQVGQRLWEWFEVDWTRFEIRGVEETEWRGLPALRVIRQVKNPKHKPDWLIVYAYEDAEFIQTQVLPLIEQCRRQYRTPLLTDKLREG